MPDFEIVELPARPVFFLTRKCASSNEAVAAAMQEGFGALGAFIGRSGIAMTGAPIATYLSYSPEGTEFELAFPTLPSEEAKTRSEPGVGYKVLPPQKVLKAVHKGPYDGVAATYQAMTDYAKRKGLKEGGPMFESYLNSPDQVPASELLTEVFFVIGD